MEDSKASAKYRFQDFVLDVDRGTLTRDGAEVSLRPKAFAVLQHLVQNSGKLVSRHALIEAAWGHPHVTDSSLSQCLRDIRAALDDQEQALVHTIPRRGYRFDLPEDSADSAANGAVGHGGENRFPRVLPIVLALVLLAGLTYLTLKENPGQEPPSADQAAFPSPASIAVLPLLDLSPEGNLGYLADGLAEEILNSLAQSEDLRVIARTSSFAFRGEDVDLDTIARKLEVDLVLEGSVRRSQDSIRVTTQLIDTASQAHLWSSTYDHAHSELFVLQTEVARDVAAALDKELQFAHQEKKTTPDAEAYEAFLIGVHALRRADPATMPRACENLDRATHLAPEFAAAWSKLSDCYRRQAFAGGKASEVLFTAYLESAERALALDPHLREADYLNALRLRFLGEDAAFQQAIAEGLESGHNDPQFLGLAMGDASDYDQFEAAVILGERAIRIDPLSAIGRNNLGYAYIGAHRYEDALAQFEKLRSIYPANEDWRVGKTIALILLERYEEAGTYAREISNPSDRQLLHAITFWGQGESDRGAALLENNEGGDELDQLGSMAQWFSFTGQTESALLTLETIREQFKVECRGPNSAVCGRVGIIWGSPFLSNIRHLPQARAWIAAYAPGYESRVEQRKTLYQRVKRSQPESG